MSIKDISVIVSADLPPNLFKLFNMNWKTNMVLEYYFDKEWHPFQTSAIEELKEIYKNIYLWIDKDLPTHVRICPYWKVNGEPYKAELATKFGHLKLTKIETGDYFPQ